MKQRISTWLCALALGCAAVAGTPTTARAAALQPAKEAEKLATAARTVYESGQFAAAAELYRKAYRLNPAKPDYLYGVGKAEQKAGRLAQAKAAFDQLLALIPADDPLAERARKALAEVVAAQGAAAPGAPQPAVSAPPAPAPAAPPPAPAPPVSAPPPPETPAAKPPAPVPAAAPLVADVTAAAGPPARPSRVPAYAALGVAAVAAIGGAAFAVAAVGADADADRYRTVGSAQFDPAKLPKHIADAVIDDINAKWMAAAVGGGVAVVAGAIGAWQWTRSGTGKLADHRPQLTSDGRHLALLWRF